MKRLLLFVVVLLLACCLAGCDETVSSGAKSSSNSLNFSAGTVASSNSVEASTTIQSSSNSADTSLTNNDVPDDTQTTSQTATYPTLEELNANAYDAEKMGPKTLEKESNYQVDIVVGDDYYATQLADMTLDFDKYEGKVVEIEGMAMKNGPYTFVGRYAENAICPQCPPGFAYYEFEWHGDEQIDLGEQKNWIKVTGKLTRGNDGVDYYYIDAYQIAIMDKWGEVSTVVN